MSSAVILLHGFSGSPANLLPIAGFLSRQFPDCRVLNPAVTGGWQGDITPFALPEIHRQLAALYFLGLLERAIHDLIKIDPAEDRKAIAPIIHCEPELGP